MTSAVPKKSPNPPDLGVDVSEEVHTDDTLGKWKPWFNGHHFFYTVKRLPPRE